MKMRILSGVLAFFLVISLFPATIADAKTSGKNEKTYKDFAVFIVTLNPGKQGEVNPDSVTVTNGFSYGELPTPTRNGYAFDGWYTEEDGGSWITNSTEVHLTENQTLYAHWTKIPSSRTVTFNPTGGTVEPTKKSVVTGAPYGDLPTPVYRNFAFEGWYTERINGKLITRTTIVTAETSHTLYAHWSKVPVVAGFCTVTLKPGTGASVTPSSIRAKYDEAYGDLPIPTRNGYTFLGWYTESTNGERVTSVTTVPHTPTLTLYAQWSKADTSEVSLSDLSYQFANSREGFKYGDDYKIDYSQYALIFGDREAARWYYENDIGWGGNCYGMAVTSGMFYQGEKGVSTEAFREGAQSPSELTIGDKNNADGWNGLSLREFIEAMQVSQKSSQIQNELNKNRDKLENLCEAVNSFHTSGSDPVVIAIARKKAGHAILGYKLVEVSSTESHLMVYDSNFPDVERYITLTRSPSGQYTGWYYHMNNQDSWGSNYEGSWISFVSYSYVRMPWVNRGKTKTDMERELLSVNTDSAAILNDANVSVATLMEGELHTERSDIFPMLEMADTKNAQADKRFSVWLPVGEYTISNQDSSVEEIQAAMVHWDQSSTIKTEASSVTYLVNDMSNANFILLDEPGKSYEISFFSSLPGAKNKITLTGVTGEDISVDNKMAFAQIDGVLYADGVSLNGENRLDVDGKTGVASDIKGSALSKIDAIIHPQAIDFEDVPYDAYCSEAVSWAVSKNITKGYSETVFGPNDTCTRAQVLTFLWRAEGSPATSVASPFADVPAGSFYENAAKWAYAKGLVSGLKFDGAAPCTRAEAVTYLWKLKNSPETELSPFSDVPPAADYAKAVAWAVEKGITNGTTLTTFSPQRICTRGQIVTFLYRHYTK